MFEHAILSAFKQTLIKASLLKKALKTRLNPGSSATFCSGVGTEMLIPFLYERGIACSRGWRIVANGAVYINANR